VFRLYTALYAEIKRMNKAIPEDRPRFDFVIGNKVVEIYSEKSAKKLARTMPDAVVKVWDADGYICEELARDIFDV